jgi:Fe-S oxidoreductase
VPATAQWYGFIPGWLIYDAVIVVALVVFVRRAYFLFRLITLGKPTVRWDEVGERLTGVLAHVLGQGRLLTEFRAGLMHGAIFWGFLILTLGTIEFFGKGFTESFFLPLMSGQPYFLVIQDFFSIAVMLAVSYAAFRRLVTKPKRLTLSAEGLVILLLIFGLMVSDLLADGARMTLAPGTHDAWAFAGNALAPLYAGLASSRVQSLYNLFWWIHCGILLGFLDWILYSKHLHVVAAPFNVFFRPLNPKGEFRSMDLEASETFGVSQITEFTWKDLFDLYNCTECGRCTAGCPANASGKELDPKLLILDLQEHLLSAGPRLLATGRGNGGAEAAAPTSSMVGELIHDNVLWGCTTCLHCVSACPVFIEHVPKIIDMRRHLVLNESRFPAELKPTFRNLENNGNPWQLSASTRADWAKDLGVKLMSDVRSAEYLYWVGCYGSFDERNKKVARAMVKILQAAKVDFAILGNEEQCTGEPARRVGHEYLFQTLAQGNIETLKRYRFQKIVTACPHCFNTIRNEYPQFDGLFQVIHHTEFIQGLIRTGRLTVTPTVAERVTYHDPCYLGRYNGIYDDPRSVLRSITKSPMVEMQLHKHKGFCCGGGGGRVWMEEHEGRRVNHLRVEQAMQVDPQLLASACPFCLTMFEDGVRAKGVDDQIATRDVAELVAQALQ